MSDRLNSITEDINNYKEWVNNYYPLNSGWDEEVLYIITIRDGIHDQQIANGNNDYKLAKEISKIDKKWQDHIRNNKDVNFRYSWREFNFPKSKWWWWIDRLDELTPEDLKTI